jgi:hypothetical protein
MQTTFCLSDEWRVKRFLAALELLMALHEHAEAMFRSSALTRMGSFLSHGSQRYPSRSVQMTRLKPADVPILGVKSETGDGPEQRSR